MSRDGLALTPERWRRVEALYLEMLARPTHERTAALAAACSGDTDLVVQVQRLLDQPESAAEFLSTLAAQLVSPDALTLVGRRLGVFDVQELLGVGGMGEVYRAQDTRLQRTVAIKILPREFTSDPERLARFGREARVLASLSHSNIGALYDVQEVDGLHALVLEFVEGETLGARIEGSGRKGRGSSLPLPEALSIASQIADALEAAHEKGIVHRDLKPANIMITPSGAVKVLDFGLAKLGVGEGSGPDLSKSPTATHGGTREGNILGTAAYMSPEQARGKPVDKRADIWAFGCVLYEMLTGRHAFGGETTSDTIAGVLDREPEWNALPAATLASIRRLLERCLTKDPHRRLRDIGEARIAIERARASASEPLAHERAVRSPTGALPWALAGLLTLALALALMAPGRRPPDPMTPLRLRVQIGADASLDGTYAPAATLSPDGKLLAFTARKAAGQRLLLYVRRLDGLNAAPLSGTEGADGAFFSPDSQWLAFFADGKLKKVATAGGAVVTLCDARDNRGGTWADDGTILFSPGVFTGLWRVSSAGGTPEAVTAPDRAAGETTHRLPQALPGSGAVLFTAGAGSSFEDASIVVQSLPNGARKVVRQGGYDGRYLESGHLVYMHEGTLFAAPFDLGHLEVTGPSVAVIERLATNPTGGSAAIAYSDRGRVVFQAGQSDRVPIQWVEDTGKTQPLKAPPGNYNNIRFSPDGGRLALDLRDGKGRDVWVYDWERDAMSRLTFDPSEDAWPVWTPDGRRVAFGSTRAGQKTPNIFWQRADGTGEAQRLTESKNPQFPTSWHPSGRFLAFHETGSQGTDIMILEVEGDERSGWKAGRPRAFMDGAASGLQAAFSPDGNWLAYAARGEVFVRPFPGPGGQWQVSSGGGHYPIWSRNRQELFYRTPDFTFMVVRYATMGNSFRAEPPRQWSSAYVPARGLNNRGFDLHPDGRRFAVLKTGVEQTEEKRDHVILIDHFFDELRRVAPPGKR